MNALNRPLLMMALPNSGSTWLAQVLARHLPDCYYYDMEFFNPLHNERHEGVLKRQFGCELAGCFRNIVAPGDASIDEDIALTWGLEPYTFTKEVFSPFKLPAFARHFRCFVLLRPVQQSFPPSRLRIWSFYEHAWHALVAAGYALRAETVRARAMEAHAVLAARMLEDADRLGVPVLRYAELFADDEALAESLRRAVGFCSTALVADIAATRRQLKAAVRQSEQRACA